MMKVFFVLSRKRDKVELQTYLSHIRNGRNSMLFLNSGSSTQYVGL